MDKTPNEFLNSSSLSKSIFDSSFCDFNLHFLKYLWKFVICDLEKFVIFDNSSKFKLVESKSLLL